MRGWRTAGNSRTLIGIRFPRDRYLMKRRYDHLFRQRRRDAQTPVPLAMPHERDEAVEHDLPRREVVVQAHADLSDGQVDTDNYTRIAPLTAPGSTRRGGVRRRP